MLSLIQTVYTVYRYSYIQTYICHNYSYIQYLSQTASVLRPTQVPQIRSDQKIDKSSTIKFMLNIYNAKRHRRVLLCKPTYSSIVYFQEKIGDSRRLKYCHTCCSCQMNHQLKSLRTSRCPAPCRFDCWVQGSAPVYGLVK